MSETALRVRRIFREELGTEPPGPDTDMIASGLLDSLSFITLLVEIEREFSITVPMEQLDIDALRTVDGIAAMIDGVCTG